MANPTLLMIRPAPQAREFMRALTEQSGKSPPTVFAPIIDICARQAEELPKDTQFLLFSSVNGVSYFAEQYVDRHITALCVGDTTAAAAQASGMIALSAGGTAADLIHLVKSKATDTAGPLVYVCGTDVSHDIDGELAELGFETTRRVVYQQIPVPLAPDALTALQHPVVIPLSSPNSAKFLLNALPNLDLSQVTFVCLSARIADNVAHTNAKILCADTPTRTAMIQILATLF